MIKFGNVQISVPKIDILMLNRTCINPWEFKIKKQKQVKNGRTISIAARQLRRKVNNLSMVVWARKTSRVHQAYQFHQIS